MNEGNGLVYQDQATAEAVATEWRDAFYNLIHDVSALNRKSLDSMKLSSLLGSSSLRASAIPQAR